MTCNFSVSVIIPAYNTGMIIRETIDSVLAQTYQDFELIIIDDGSRAETSDIIKTYKDPRIRYYYQENRGMAAARNRGIKLSHGKYIAFLDHDDVWLPEKLERQQKAFQTHPDAGIVFSPVIFFNEDREWSQPIPTECSFQTMLKINFIFSCSCAMVKKDALLYENEYFDPKCVPSDDYDLWLRLGQNCKIVKIPEPLVRYRVHENNASHNLTNIHLALLTIYPKLYPRIKWNPAYSQWEKFRLLASFRRSYAWACRACSRDAENVGDSKQSRKLAFQAVKLFPLQPMNWIHWLKIAAITIWGAIPLILNQDKRLK